MLFKTSSALLLLLVLGAVYSQPTISIKAYLDAHNKARTNPKFYATFIANEYKTKVDITTNVHKTWRLKFFEKCPSQFDGAIKAMNAQAALKPLQIDLGMTYSVWQHVNYLATTLKGLSHSGASGSTPSQRAQPYTSGSSLMFENILYTGVSTYKAEHLVAQYIIDDGVASRGHRLNIYKDTQTKIGVGIAYDFTLKRIYHGTVMANSYNCDKCTLITCQMQKDCGWSQYLLDAGLPDPCRK